MDPITIIGLILGAAADIGPAAAGISQLAATLSKTLNRETITPAELEHLNAEAVLANARMNAQVARAIAAASSSGEPPAVPQL